MLDMLDVVIGVTFYFLLVSLVVMAATELIELMWKQREEYLAKGIRALLQEGKGGQKGLANLLYRHPMIRPLYSAPSLDSKTSDEPETRSIKDLKDKPSYIPSREFALALLDLLGLPEPKEGETLVARLGRAEGPTGVDDATLEAIKKALTPLLADVGADLEKAIESIEMWYNSAMDRVSGWYKRRAQWVAFGLGLLFAVALNADAVFVVRSLSQDDDLRAVYLAAAEAYVDEAARTLGERPAEVPRDTTTKGDASAVASDVSSSDLSTEDESPKEQYERAVAQIGALGLPLGWSRSSPSALWPHRLTTEEQKILKADSTKSKSDIREDREIPPTIWDGVLWWIAKLFGLSVTGIAVSLGAPFWFDILNKVMVVRSTVKPSGT